MRRYLLFYLSAVFVFCTFLLGGILWMNHADQKNEIPFEKEIINKILGLLGTIGIVISEIYNFFTWHVMNRKSNN